MKLEDEFIESDLVGRTAKLPGGPRVVIEGVFSDGKAWLRRIDGEFKGRTACCAIASLELEPESGSTAEAQPPAKSD